MKENKRFYCFEYSDRKNCRINMLVNGRELSRMRKDFEYEYYGYDKYKNTDDGGKRSTGKVRKWMKRIVVSEFEHLAGKGYKK